MDDPGLPRRVLGPGGQPGPAGGPVRAGADVQPRVRRLHRGVPAPRRRPPAGPAGAIWLVAGRVVQGIGAAFLIANSAAILTDAFPANQRGLALGINNIAGISGTFIGLVLGGLLGPVDWRLVFLISVPPGVFGTVWAYLKLEERGERHRAAIDWWGNITFAVV